VWRRGRRREYATAPDQRAIVRTGSVSYAIEERDADVDAYANVNACYSATDAFADGDADADTDTDADGCAL
jgi:hypothetical protein